MRPVTALAASSSSSSSAAADDGGSVTLMEFAGKGGIGVNDDLVVLLDHIQYACKRIAALVASPFNYTIGKQTSLGDVPTGGSERDAPKPLDIISVCFSLSNLLQLGVMLFF